MPRFVMIPIVALAGTLMSGMLAAEEKPPKLAEQARAILEKHCHSCHGEGGTVEGGLNFVLDRRQLVARKKIAPGNLAASLLYQRVARGEMPPDGSDTRPAEEEVALLRQWIEAGAPEFAAAALRTFITLEQTFEELERDLLASPERDRRYLRYFSLTHLYNAGVSEDELETHRSALAKLVNSLSWGRRIVVPLAIDECRTVYRIDLRDYKWNEQVWEQILARYPYGIGLQSKPARYCCVQTNSVLPLVRGDWFVAAASRPPLYHEVLQLPETDLDLEKQLLVDVAENLRVERVARAGFNGSGVSRNNRLIERHESAYGAYWKSYDFAGNVDRQNLFAYPLGPGTAKDEASGFLHDGGELIFSLPNGLHGYLLVDRHGARIDKGPTEIVSDPRQADRAVVNGISCMSCHVNGMIQKSDQVRASVQANRSAFEAAERDTILALYPAEADFSKLLREDEQRFLRAVKETGTRVGTTEPIVALAKRFEAELDLPLAAAEAGLTPEEFKRLLGREPKLARVLGPLATEGGTVQRQTWIQTFGDTALALNLRLVSGDDLPLDLPASDAVFLRDQAPQAVAILDHPNAQLLQSVTVGGAKVEHGLFTVPPKWNTPAHVRFDLKKHSYRYLYGGVGISDDIPRAFSALTFRVVGDGKALFVSRPLRNKGERQEFEVQVAGVSQLELYVDCPGPNHNGHAVWIDPRLSVGKPRPAANAAALGGADAKPLPGKLHKKPIVRASNSALRDTPDMAFDGDPKTFWRSGGWPEQWIEADLGGRVPLAHIRLMVGQRPDGDTEHEIWLSDNPLGASRDAGRCVHTFRGYTVDFQLLDFAFPAGTQTRYVQVRTIKSPSWVSWCEIEIRAQK